jgi:hypothetical protein
MAKKKTAGSDNTTGMGPAAPKRRTPAKRDDTTTARSSAVSETFDAGGSIAAADDRRAALAGANGHSDAAPSYEEIAEAAYQRYLSRGGQHGRDFDDWVEAERELRARH